MHLSSCSVLIWAALCSYWVLWLFIRKWSVLVRLVSFCELPCVLWYTGTIRYRWSEASILLPLCCLAMALLPSFWFRPLYCYCLPVGYLFWLVVLIFPYLPDTNNVATTCACLVVLLVVVSSMIVLGWVSLILVYALLFDLSVALFCLPRLYQCLRACLIQTPFILLVCVCLCAGLLCRVDYCNFVIVWHVCGLIWYTGNPWDLLSGLC
jgi:hypothetical protein